MSGYLHKQWVGVWPDPSSPSERAGPQTKSWQSCSSTRQVSRRAATVLNYVALRPLTRGKRFLLFCQIPTLPIMVASYLHLGGACPPHWVFQGFVALGQVSGGNEGRGGGWAHPPIGRSD